jgi:phosphatidylinositol alpha-1,6-mannosyltransferase
LPRATRREDRGLNVLVLATKYFGLGGAEAYTRMFAEAVAANGNRVDVLSLLNGEAADRSCPGRYLGDQGSLSTPVAHARFVGQAIRHARGRDVIVCSHVALAPVGHILLRLYRVPYVVIGYGIEVWDALGPRRQEGLRRAARVVALSRFTARQIAAVHKVPETRLAVVHPAVDPVLLREAAVSAPARVREKVMLLTVARLSAQEQYKGCDTVISALPEVLANAGPVAYVIAGDGDDRPRLERLAVDGGAGDAVTFAGAVQRSNLPAFYRKADIFVMPSVAERRDGRWTGEGFGIVYIEAAAFGLPVVAGDGGGAPEAVQDGVTGYVVDGRDLNAVAAALVRLAGDAELRARMGTAGRRWAGERFTFERFTEDVRSVLETVAASVP